MCVRVCGVEREVMQSGYNRPFVNANSQPRHVETWTKDARVHKLMPSRMWVVVSTERQMMVVQNTSLGGHSSPSPMRFEDMDMCT